MNKLTQAILLGLVISISAAARLSLLGWMYFIGIGSVLILSLGHLYIHATALNYLAQKGDFQRRRIILSHIFFLCVFLFQTDADDSRSYLVLAYILDIKISINSVELWAQLIVVTALIGLIYVDELIWIKSKSADVKGERMPYATVAVIISLVFPLLLSNVIFSRKEKRELKLHEDKGIYYSAGRALKNKEKVIVLEINRYNTQLKEFPNWILELPNVKEITLNEQSISTIPDQIYRLEKLEVLNMIDNKIKVINESICKCKSLTELRVGGEIASFPDCLKEMKTLNHLTVQSNTVNELMEELTKFKYLKTAHFYLKDGIFDNKKWDSLEKQTGITHKY